MRISLALAAQLAEHALLEAPNECCGMIAVRDGEAVNVYSCANAAESEYRFEIDGIQQMGVLKDIELMGWKLGAIYHSHTRAPPIPSTLDIVTHAYRDALMVIIGVPPDGGPPVIRAFTVAEYTEVPVELT